MKLDHINFYYFSGTGNTLLVVERMKEVFEGKGIGVDLHRIENSDPEKIDPNTVIGLAFPVALQGTYPFVWDFINALPGTNGTPVFMVDTLHMFSGGIQGPLRKVLERKGYRPFGAKEIIMPNNLFLWVTATGAKKDMIIRKGLMKAEEYAGRIVAGNTRWRRVPLLSDAISMISRGGWVWKLGRNICSFEINMEKCTKCGLCARLCPVKNIEIKEYPEFHDRCVLCMRCVSFCPVRAIYQGKDKYRLYRAVEAGRLTDDAREGCDVKRENEDV